MPEQATAIAALNDKFRKTLTGGKVMLTRGVSELGSTAVGDLLLEVRTFRRFTEENDPHGEHDCAVLDVDGIRVLFKIDYFDRDLIYHSPDPSDPSLTLRVMTVMRADE
ncbi:MAG TPA: DUF3768 domain-containing protein, partial [Stellaceae bacterium]|nr:DUF3768 domain-containing protein [Stellaceae bacterium]